MNFSSDAMADFEGLLEVNRKICKQQMAEKASPTLPTNCAVLPQVRLEEQQKLPLKWRELFVWDAAQRAWDICLGSWIGGARTGDEWAA